MNFHGNEKTAHRIIDLAKNAVIDDGDFTAKEVAEHCELLENNVRHTIRKLRDRGVLKYKHTDESKNKHYEFAF